MGAPDNGDGGDDVTRAEFEKAQAKYRATYNALFLQSQRAGSAAECDEIDLKLKKLNSFYDTAKAAYAAAGGR